MVEEIPARMQAGAIEDFAKLVVDGLDKAHISYSNVRTCVSPRRITFSADMSPVIEEFIEEKKGPQASAPTQIIDKFLKANGISRADCVEKEIDKKKIALNDPIKGFGTFEVKVKLHTKVTATLKVKVVEEK